MKSKLETLWYSREAGHVTRNHAWPTLRNQTDGHHSYNAAMIYLIYNPNPNLETVRELLVHDTGERAAGDAPHPAKQHDPIFRKCYEAMEMRARENYGLGPDEGLFDEDLIWVYCCDMLEFGLFCLEELTLGNQYAREKLNRVIAILEKRIAKDAIPEELVPLAESVIHRNIIILNDEECLND